MSQCPEFAARAAMTDDQFWDHVLKSQQPVEVDPSDDPIDPPAIDEIRSCPECGERGACGYDTEGRPMIHVLTKEES